MSLRGLLLFSALLFYRVLGDTVQRIVDDQLGDLVTGQQIQYSSDWSQGNGCSYCTAKPSPGSAMNGTWHDISWNPSQDPTRTMTMQFTGIAVQVFLIGAKSTLTDVLFTLDNTRVGRYTSSFPDGDQFVYNVEAFSQSGIPDGDHTLEMQSFGTQNVLILFDYAVYTTNVNIVKTPSTTSPVSSTPVQEVPATSNSPNPVSSGSSPTPVVSADPLRSPGSNTISTSRSILSGSSVPNSSGSLTANSSLSGSSSSSFASGSSPGSTVANPTGGVAQNPVGSPQPTSENSPSRALLSNRRTNVGAIVGGLFGGLVWLAVMILGAILYFRRKRKPALKSKQTEEKHQFRIIPFSTPFVGGRSDTRTQSPSPSPSSEKQRLAARFGDSTAILPSTDQDPASAEQQISSLLAEVEALRAREAAAGSSNMLPSPRNVEIAAILREEAARLQAHHSQEHLLGHSITSSPPLNEDFFRELVSLRAEVEEIRLRQDIPSYGELPGYTPPSTQ